MRGIELRCTGGYIHAPPRRLNIYYDSYKMEDKEKLDAIYLGKSNYYIGLKEIVKNIFENINGYIIEKCEVVEDCKDKICGYIIEIHKLNEQRQIVEEKRKVMVDNDINPNGSDISYFIKELEESN